MFVSTPGFVAAFVHPCLSAGAGPASFFGNGWVAAHGSAQSTSAMLTKAGSGRFLQGFYAKAHVLEKTLMRNCNEDLELTRIRTNNA